MKRIITAAIIMMAASFFAYAQSSSIPAAAGGGGAGTVTSVNGSNGVATTTGSAFTGSGTLWANWPRNAQTGTSYALVTGDRGKVVTLSNASAIAVTIAQAGTTGFETGWITAVKNIGAGTVTITPTTSTVDGAATITLLTGDWALISSDGTNYETVNNKAIAGSGVSVTTARTGKQVAADTAVMESRATQQASASTYSVTAGTSTVYTAALTPTLTAYTNGGVVRVKWDETCGANPTINVDTLGVRKIYKRNGTSASAQLGAGECIANQTNVLTYNSSLDSGTGGFETDIGGGGSSAFSAITGGTNTGAAMIVGAGASLRANAADSTAPNKSGTSLPGTCTVGDSYMKTDNPTHEQLYACTATNTWTIQGMKQATSLLFFPFGPLSATAGTAFTEANQVNYYAWVPSIDYTPSTLRAFMTSTGGDVGDMAWGIYDASCKKLYQTDTIAGASTQDRNTWTFASPTKLVAGTLYYIAFASNNSASSVFISVGGYWNYIAGDGFFFRGSEASSTSAGVTTLPATCGTKTEFFTESTPAITIR